MPPTLLHVLVSCAVVHPLTTATAQNPTPYRADPGPLQADPNGSGLSVAAGLQLTQLFSTIGTIPIARDLVIGPGGHLYLTSVTAISGQPGSSHVWRVPMVGDEPAQPFTIELATTAPVKGHFLSYDPENDQLWISGSGTASTEVYRLPASPLGTQSTATALPFNFNDPDGIAWAHPAGSPCGLLFVAEQNRLSVVEVGPGCSGNVTHPNVDLTATTAGALGNWGTLRWDDSTQSLVGEWVGNGNLTVDISWPGWVATETAQPQLWSTIPGSQGFRYWSEDGAVVIHDNAASPPVTVPVISGFAGFPRIAAAPGGGLFVLDQSTGTVYRLDRVLDVDTLLLPSATGGVVNFAIQAPPSAVSEAYLLLAGITGATPGFSYGPTTVPLNVDGITTSLLGAAATLPGWTGVFAANGNSAALPLPGGLGLHGFTAHFSLVSLTSNFASNAVWFHFD